jgi:DNA-binding CsgD family transcriptional regulator/PAS domain-containing protein
MIAAFGLTSPFKASYNEHYSRLNVWRDRGRGLYVQGRVVVDDEMCPRSELVASEFYNDYLLPIGAVHCAGGVVAREDDDVLTIAAMRGHGRPFQAHDCRAIEALLPHVNRAHAIGRRLQLLETDQSVLDSLDVGVAFLTAAGQWVHGNRSAEAMVAAGDGLRLCNRVLRAADPSVDGRLRQVWRDATAVSAASSLAVAVARPSGRRAYQLLAAPLRHGLPAFTGLPAPQVVVLMIDPESRRAAAPEVLAGLYGLTRREALLTSRLSCGTTLEGAAEELGMTYETARSHLRHIFEKTDTSRQTELILLLARLPKSAPATAIPPAAR